MDEKDKTAKKDNNKVLLIASHFMVAVLIGIFAFTGISRSSSSIQARMAETLIQFSEFTAAAQSRNDEPAMEDADEPESSDKEEKETKSAAKDLDDGEYTGSGQGYGGQITMKLVVEGGTIKTLEIASASGETPAYLNMARAIIPKIIAKGSANVDGVSGATYSSNGIKAAAAQAIKQAGGDGSVSLKKAAPKQKGKDGKKSKKRSYKKPKGGWKDGTFTGSARGYGGTVSVKVKIKNGKIKSISASGKGETGSYWRRAQAVKGRIIKAQNPRVDAVSGATYSSNGIINAVIGALNKAKKSGRKSQVISTKEETYLLDEGETQSIGAKAKTSLTYKSADSKIAKVSKSGKITGVSAGSTTITIAAKKTKKFMKAVKKVKVTVFEKEPDDPDDPDDPDKPDGPDKPDDPGEKINGTFTGSAMGYGGQVTATVVIKDSVIESITVEGKNETNKYWVKANKIVNKMISKQTWDVDAVSGATLSSNGIRNAVKQALESAGMI